MARARNIKPAFFKNEKLVELPMATRLLFIGLWTLADREGRLEARPKRIKMEIFPGDSVDVDKALTELDAGGFIQRYEVAGELYIQILAFGKHQNPHHREPASTIPAPQSPGLDTDATAPKPEVSPPLQPMPALGKAEAGPGPALLIPDSPSLIPESGELHAPSASPSTPARRVNGSKSHASEDTSEVIERIPLNDGTEFEVRKSILDELERLYPAVDAIQTLREIRGWNLAEKAKRKTRTGVTRHIFSWFAREQDRAGGARH